MTYLIGDIHANIQELQSLLPLLKLQKGDELIFLGDYIDKFSYTRETLVLLEDLQAEYTCVFIKGNHEYIWEDYLNGNVARQEFLRAYGGLEALQGYGSDVQDAFHANDFPVLRDALSPYMRIIEKCKDWHIVGEYLAVHAGLLSEQYHQKDLVFTEKNFFVRPSSMETDKKYLDTYTLVGGHTFIDPEPTAYPGYINIDLGAGHKKYLGAFCIDTKTVIRSDGKTFSL
jgi:serine/threonine protein phosphatase 1